MSELSGRAQRMLARGKRLPFPRDRDEIARRLLECEPHAGILDVLARYGGIEYWVRGGGGLDLDFDLDDPDNWHFGAAGRHMFQIGYREGTSMIHSVDADGTIWAVEGKESFRIASSIDVLIESDAVQDAMFDHAEHWSRITMPMLAKDNRISRLDGLMTDWIGAESVPEASDEYVMWWSKEDVRVRWEIVSEDRSCCTFYATPRGEIDRVLGAVLRHGMLGGRRSGPGPFERGSDR